MIQYDKQLAVLEHCTRCTQIAMTALLLTASCMADFFPQFPAGTAAAIAVDECTVLLKKELREGVRRIAVRALLAWP